MKRPLTLLTIVFFIVFWGCNNAAQHTESKTTTVIGNQDSPKRNVFDSYNCLTDDYKGAFLPDTLRCIKLFHFSSREAEDTFEMKAEPGMLFRSKSFFTIKTSTGKIIFRDSFHTHSLVKYIFEPDTMSKFLSNDESDKYLSDYRSSLTKKNFEDYLHKQVDSFFTGFFTDNKSTAGNVAYGEIINRQLYDKVMGDSTIVIIDLNSWDNDEGQIFISYSSKEGKAIAFMESD